MIRRPRFGVWAAQSHRCTSKNTGGNHAGEGDVDFPAVFDAAHAVGYDSWFVLETPGKDDPLRLRQKISIS